MTAFLILVCSVASALCAMYALTVVGRSAAEPELQSYELFCDRCERLYNLGMYKNIEEIDPDYFECANCGTGHRELTLFIDSEPHPFYGDLEKTDGITNDTTTIPRWQDGQGMEG